MDLPQDSIKDRNGFKNSIDRDININKNDLVAHSVWFEFSI